MASYRSIVEPPCRTGWLSRTESDPLRVDGLTVRQNHSSRPSPLIASAPHDLTARANIAQLFAFLDGCRPAIAAGH
jgi:hypothetical protein